MIWHRAKRDKVDDLFSKFIRHRDGWRCVRCGKQYNPFDSSSRQFLDNSHYFGRGCPTVRFDPENCDSLCKLNCHRIWQNDDREAYRAFKIKQLGELGFNALDLRAHQKAPIKGGRYFGSWLDKDLIYLILKEEESKWGWK